MKRHYIAAAVAGLTLVGLFMGTRVQARRLDALRKQIAERTAVPLPPTQSPEAAHPSPPPLTDTELAELLTLRRDVGRLRQQKAEVARWQTKVDQLQANLTRTNSLDSGGYLPAARSRFMGYATPADALQSFIYASHERDAQLFLQVIHPDARANFAADIEKQGAEAFFKKMIPGFEIVRFTETRDGEGVAVLRIDPRREHDWEIRMERVNGEWRVRFD